MKKYFALACTAVFIISCNNQPAAKDSAAMGTASTDTSAIEYAYLPEHHPADYWERGDQRKVAMVLKGLKGMETGNIEAAIAPFADSIYWSADGMDAKISKDSLRATLTAAWKNFSSMKIMMDDYEAVVSKDKKEEFVTLWYKQIITDKAGKVDSMAYVDDLKIENGKITSLDEKGRKYTIKK